MCMCSTLAKVPRCFTINKWYKKTDLRKKRLQPWIPSTLNNGVNFSQYYIADLQWWNVKTCWVPSSASLLPPARVRRQTGNRCWCSQVPTVLWLSSAVFVIMIMRGNVSRVVLILVPPVDKSCSALSLLHLLSLPNSFCHAQKAGTFRNLFRHCLMRQKCWSDVGDSSFLLSVVRPLWNHCSSQSMNKATLAHSRIIRCPTLLLTFPHPCSNPPMTPRLTGQQMRGQYLRAWEDKDWIWAVCVCILMRHCLPVELDWEPSSLI